MVMWKNHSKKANKKKLIMLRKISSISTTMAVFKGGLWVQTPPEILEKIF
jgi:hypothetical protein